ncbi:MAG: transposase [Caldilineaceae bacterium]
MKHITFLLHRFLPQWRDQERSLPLIDHPLDTGTKRPRVELPSLVQHPTIADHLLTLLAPVRWEAFPHRRCDRVWPGPAPHDPVPYLVAFLLKIDQEISSMGKLVDFLVQHPEIVWLAGFPLHPDETSVWGFDPTRSVPSPTLFSQVLRRFDNRRLQFLLDETVRQLRATLPSDAKLGMTISFDTKHILAWVKENNQRTYIEEGRYDKKRQPKGDPDCRLGCKRRRNKSPEQLLFETPTKEGTAAEGIGAGIGEFYWGYASGIVATKIPKWGEFVLAEWTQPFDQSDVAYFFPLMAQTERRLGKKPQNGTADAAFDAFYIYEYFHNAGGIAAIPFVQRGREARRIFLADGTPCCDAGLPMSLANTFINRSSLIEHERQRWACPLCHPQANGQNCPIQHKNWAKGGCLTTIASSIGARLRYEIDRESELYRHIYAQRTASERIFSQAKASGIERPKLRNYQSIANYNTLIYTLLNLRALERIRHNQLA